MRIFIGIKLDDCLEEIIKIQEGLKLLDPEANYTKKDNIHMTLAFLGELLERDVLKLKNILDRIDYFSFEIETLKVKRMRDMLILEVKPETALLDLQSILEENLRRAGFYLENRKFYPHITLSRKTKINVDKVYKLKSAVREMIIFSSERSENGLTYRPLHIKKLDYR